MSEKKQTDANINQTSNSLYTIEELQKKNNTSQAIYRGVCVGYGWKSGKMVTEAEYAAAINKFSTSPIGKKVK